MTSYEYLVVITNRDYAQAYLEFLGAHGAEHVLSKFCEGTATASTLDLFGLHPTEKVMMQTIVCGEQVPNLVRHLKTEMNIEAAGNGIALFLPIDALGGASSGRYFHGAQTSQNKEHIMNEPSKNVLIIALTNKGNAELVMDAAKDAGATGGTLVHAHGTGTDVAKFFGVSISEEKDMIHIVAPRQRRDAIIRAIMEKAGANTPAHGIVYCLPIDTVVGIKALED